mmetsp:Transcript_24044/g.67574  ORF Transcript_24044/g.67574 Transcript_24044/m.67574 type:complete len:220 (-) Transcript_24044:10-669(-)
MRTTRPPRSAASPTAAAAGRPSHQRCTAPPVGSALGHAPGAACASQARRPTTTRPWSARAYWASRRRWAKEMPSPCGMAKTRRVHSRNRSLSSRPRLRCGGHTGDSASAGPRSRSKAPSKASAEAQDVAQRTPLRTRSRPERIEGWRYSWFTAGSEWPQSCANLFTAWCRDKISQMQRNSPSSSASALSSSHSSGAQPTDAAKASHSSASKWSSATSCS